MKEIVILHTEELLSLLMSVLAPSDGATRSGEEHGKDSVGELKSTGDDSSSAQSTLCEPSYKLLSLTTATKKHTLMLKN